MEWSKDTEKSFSYWTQYLGNHKIEWFINLSAIGHYLRFAKQFWYSDSSIGNITLDMK